MTIYNENVWINIASVKARILTIPRRCLMRSSLWSVISMSKSYNYEHTWDWSRRASLLCWNTLAAIDLIVSLRTVLSFKLLETSCSFACFKANSSALHFFSAFTHHTISQQEMGENIRETLPWECRPEWGSMSRCLHPGGIVKWATLEH